MQILTFTVAAQPYAIPSRAVLEVLPLVPARPVPLLPDYVAGVFAYRGTLVPLVDLRRRFGAPAEHHAARPRLSTRVIVVEFANPESAEPAESSRPTRLGLVADDVVSIQVTSDEQATAATMPHAPFLGRLLRLAGGTIQMIAVDRLLPPELLDGLAAAATGVDAP